jgi:arginase
VRAVDPGEQAFIDAERMTVLDVDRFSDPAAAGRSVAATGATSVYVHVDLDVLDPSAIAGLSYPLPFGADADALVALVRAVVAAFPLAGASIAGFAPASPESAIDDLPTILRLVGALTSGAA